VLGGGSLIAPHKPSSAVVRELSRRASFLLGPDAAGSLSAMLAQAADTRISVRLGATTVYGFWMDFGMLQHKALVLLGPCGDCPAGHGMSLVARLAREASEQGFIRLYALELTDSPGSYEGLPYLALARVGVVGCPQDHRVRVLLGSGFKEDARFLIRKANFDGPIPYALPERLSFRKASMPVDAGLVAEVINGSMEGRPEWIPVSPGLCSNLAHVTILYEDEIPVGFYHIEPSICSIRNVGVLPAYRGRGFGRLLEKELINDLVRLGCKSISFETSSSNRIVNAAVPKSYWSAGVLSLVRYVLDLKNRSEGAC